MNRRFLARCALVLCAAIAPACGSGVATEPIVTSVAGTWSLTAANGKPLPFVYSASDPKLELISKQYVITATGTFTVSYVLRGTELDGTVNTTTTSDAGNSSLENNTVTFVYRSDGSIVTAHVTATTMTIDGSVPQVFTKQ